MTRAPADGPGNGPGRTMYTRAVYGGCPADRACGGAVLVACWITQRAGPSGAAIPVGTSGRSRLSACCLDERDARRTAGRPGPPAHTDPGQPRTRPSESGACRKRASRKAPHQPHGDASWRGLPSTRTHGCRPHPSGSGQRDAGSSRRRSRDETAINNASSIRFGILPPCYLRATALLPHCYLRATAAWSLGLRGKNGSCSTPSRPSWRWAARDDGRRT
jgi:hypothetical protein